MAQCFLSKCDNPYCQGILHSSTSEDKGLQDCLVCLEELQDKEMALLSDCDHVCCSACIKKLKGDRWAYRCPYCSQNSHGALFSTKQFKGEEKKRLFKEHVDCFQNDPNLMKLLDKVRPRWRILIERLLREEIRNNTPFRIECQEILIDAECLYWGSKYAIFEIEKEPASKVMIYCVFPNFELHVIVTTEQLFYECNDEYADQVVDWFNQQFASSWEEIPGILNPDHSEFMFWRRFDDIHCGLSIKKHAKVTPCEKSDAMMKDKLMCLLGHNFLFELDEDDIDTAFVNFFLVTDFDQMFEMEGDNFREFIAKLAAKSINDN